MTKKQKTGIWLIVAPFLLLILVLVLQIINRLAGSGGGFTKVVNLFSVLAGSLFVLGFLPAIITGIVLLVTGAKRQDVEVLPQQPVQPQVPQQQAYQQPPDDTQLPPTPPVPS